MGDVDAPARTVAGQQGVSERRIVRRVPQLPQGDGEVIEAVADAAVVEVDQLDLASVEERVSEVQVGVDETDVVDAPHDVAHPGRHRLEAVADLGRQERPAFRGRRDSVHHDVGEERLVVPANPHEARRWGPGVGVVVQQSCGGTEPAQVNRAGRRLVDPPIHPAQHRADPGLIARGCRGGRRAVPGQEHLRDGQVGVGPEGPQPGDLGADCGRRSRRLGRAVVSDAPAPGDGRPHCRGETSCSPRARRTSSRPSGSG